MSSDRCPDEGEGRALSPPTTLYSTYNVKNLAVFPVLLSCSPPCALDAVCPKLLPLAFLSSPAALALLFVCCFFAHSLRTLHYKRVVHSCRVWVRERGELGLGGREGAGRKERRQAERKEKGGGRDAQSIR